MKLEYISHSCLYADTGDVKIVMDPWFNGSAFCNQWHLFPKPVNADILKSVDHILISHGHEDHLHHNSLNVLPKNAKVFYPYLWKKGIKEFLGELGFQNITETVSYKRYQIAENTKITFLTTSMDTLMVIESHGKILVNLNDSLNSHHKNVVRLFINEIKKHWNKIDYLFLGLGGAGYFPNTIHHKSKNDFETGLLREQLLVHNFCHLVHELNPKQVLPFAPGFVLLNDDKKWINDVKFPREDLLDYYKKYFDPSPLFELIVLYPGDRLVNGVFEKKSPYHSHIKNNSLNHLIDEMYADEIKDANKIEMNDEKTAAIVFEKIRKYVPQTASVLTTEILEQVNYAICLTDIPSDNYISIEFKKGHWNIFRTNDISPGNKLVIRTKSRFINHSLDYEWGGDVLVGGYSCDIDIIDEVAIGQNLDLACLRLLTRYPVGSKTMQHEPLRAAKYLFTNPVLTKLSFKQRFFTPNKLNKIEYNERNRWINKTKCEVCQACNIPLLSYEFGESLSN